MFHCGPIISNYLNLLYIYIKKCNLQRIRSFNINCKSVSVKIDEDEKLFMIRLQKYFIPLEDEEEDGLKFYKCKLCKEVVEAEEEMMVEHFTSHPRELEKLNNMEEEEDSHGGGRKKKPRSKVLIIPSLF